MEKVAITRVTPQNAKEETLFCVKDVKSSAFECKHKWFTERYSEGLRINILNGENDRMIGVIEYVPADSAWRPVDAHEFMFIHCMDVYSKKDRNQGYGSLLVEECEKQALANGMSGVCVMASKGSWMADSDLFSKNGYEVVDQRGRFDLLSKKWNGKAINPKLRDWETQQSQYQGWHLIYADQCPWHEKSVEAMLHTAADFEVDLQVEKLTTAEEAKSAPSGFGVFSLMHDGQLVEDHYLSATRFRNILKKELTKAGRLV